MIYRGTNLAEGCEEVEILCRAGLSWSLSPFCSRLMKTGCAAEDDIARRLDPERRLMSIVRRSKRLSFSESLGVGKERGRCVVEYGTEEIYIYIIIKKKKTGGAQRAGELGCKTE